MFVFEEEDSHEKRRFVWANEILICELFHDSISNTYV